MIGDHHWVPGCRGVKVWFHAWSWLAASGSVESYSKTSHLHEVRVVSGRLWPFVSTFLQERPKDFVFGRGFGNGSHIGLPVWSRKRRVIFFWFQLYITTVHHPIWGVEFLTLQDVSLNGVVDGGNCFSQRIARILTGVSVSVYTLWNFCSRLWGSWLWFGDTMRSELNWTIYFFIS